MISSFNPIILAIKIQAELFSNFVMTLKVKKIINI